MLGEVYLFNRNARGKIILTHFSNEINEDGFYEIHKQTGQLGGKLTIQPSKVIEKGKAKRTLEQQFELEFKSIVKKLRDKGYKHLIDDLELTLEDVNDQALLESKLGTMKTTADGFRKPSLALTAQSQTEETLSRAWWTSLKLDGYRTLVHLESTEEGVDYLVFKTRGGGVYKGVAETLKHNEFLIDIIRTYNCEIDGEFYIHGLPLKDHTTVCNTEEYNSELHDSMVFNIFDLPDDKSTTNERVTLLHQLADDYEADEANKHPRINFIRHTYVVNAHQIAPLLDKAVEDGYEGIMARSVGDKYQWGKRNKSLIKFKPFTDDEFQIIRIIQGNRHIHDMVFEMYTKDKTKTFRCVPLGDFFARKHYTENEKDYVGKMATVKYHKMNPETGIPQLPTFVSVRESGT